MDKKVINIGHATHTERGTLLVKVSPHIDKTKLYTMMVSGVEIKKSKADPIYHSAADQYAA